MTDDDDFLPEDQAGFAGFEGPCTCDHEPDDHTWGECAVIDDGSPIVDGERVPCPCEAGWAECPS